MTKCIDVNAGRYYNNVDKETMSDILPADGIKNKKEAEKVKKHKRAFKVGFFMLILICKDSY